MRTAEQKEFEGTRLWVDGVELKPVPMEERDQAPFAMGANGFLSTATYTPAGIRQLDSDFCMAILKAKTRTQLLKVREEIKACPHLHRKRFKSNLLLNVRIRLKEKTVK